MLAPSVFMMLPPPPTEVAVASSSPAPRVLLGPLVKLVERARAGAPLAAALVLSAEVAAPSAAAKGEASAAATAVGDAPCEGPGAAAAPAWLASVAGAAAAAVPVPACRAGGLGGLGRSALLLRTSTTGTAAVAGGTAPGAAGTGRSAASEKRPPPSRESKKVSPITGARKLCSSDSAAASRSRCRWAREAEAARCKVGGPPQTGGPAHRCSYPSMPCPLPAIAAYPAGSSDPPPLHCTASAPHDLPAPHLLHLMPQAQRRRGPCLLVLLLRRAVVLLQELLGQGDQLEAADLALCSILRSRLVQQLAELAHGRLCQVGSIRQLQAQLLPRVIIREAAAGAGSSTAAAAGERGRSAGHAAGGS